MKRLLSLCTAVLLPWLASAAPMVNSVITNGLFEPYGIAVDNNGFYYLTDNSQRVLRYIPDTGQLSSLAGGDGETGLINGPGIFARFFAPKGIAMFRGGLAVADSANHVIRFVDISGKVAVVSTLAGRGDGPGKPDDNTASQVRFNNPSGLAFDGTNLFIADTKNNAIRKLDTFNNVITLSTNFNEPWGMAAGPNGELFVSDTRNHAIKVLTPQPNGTYSAALLAGSAASAAGANDDLFAEKARFNNPGGLLWAGGETGLIVADTGNHTLRRLFLNQDLTAYFGTNVWTVETYAGAPGQMGRDDGALLASRFFFPQSLAADHEGGWLVVDSGNSAIRRVQIEPPQPPVLNPVIGYVIFVTNSFGVEVSKLIPINNATFYNDEIIAIKGEPFTVIYTKGNTPKLSEKDTIPTPSPGGTNTAYALPPYYDGLTRDQVPASLINSSMEHAEDLTLKALGVDGNRRPSEVAQARLQFKAAPPIVLGDNPRNFIVRNYTENSLMYYRYDPQGATGPIGPLTNGPLSSGQTVFLPVTNDIIFRIMAVRTNYQVSEIVTKTFSITNFSDNTISLGFDRTGADREEAYSLFTAAPGQRFYAPVVMKVLPAARMYSLQFNVMVTNVGSAPAVNAGTINFESMLKRIIPGTTPPSFEIITNYMFIESFFNPGYSNVVFTNFQNNLIGVGWLERYGMTNLYNTLIQDLITYSQPHDRMFLSKDGSVILGSYSFQVPGNASAADAYQITVGRPSATSDGVSAHVYIDTPTNGFRDGPGLNTIKNVHVAHPWYLVGDCAPFHWLNAGEFGDTNLYNNDVMQVFQSMWWTNAVTFGGLTFTDELGYGINMPLAGSDFYGAMDSSNAGKNPALIAWDGSDNTVINQMGTGDGVLDVTDLYVTFRRSLDPSLLWFVRYWSNGVLNADANVVPNHFRLLNKDAAARETSVRAVIPAGVENILSSTAAPAVEFMAEDIIAQPGQIVSIPFKARIAGKFPIRVLMFNVTLHPLDGSPAITQPVRFLPAEGLGDPTYSNLRNPNDYSGVWLNSKAAGIWGTNVAGTLLVKIPEDASPMSAYKLQFNHVSASPNGLGLFPLAVRHGLVTLSDRTQSSLNDAIPDHWRLRYFGTVSNLLSAASADADGDGLTNVQEFRAGTNPTDVRSVLRLLSGRQAGAQHGLVLRWPSASSKTYTLEWSPSLIDPQWSTLATRLPGTGWTMDYTDTGIADGPRFYRVRVE